MHSCENVYRIPNVNVRFQSCRTNIPSNTAFRGFGQPQAVFACEYVMNEIADTLGMSPDEVSISIDLEQHNYRFSIL